MDILEFLVEGSTDLPSILLGIGVAYLTILITVAIAIFGDRTEFDALDRNLILDHIVDARYLLVYLAFMFFPFLFWNSSILWMRILEIILWGVGVFFMTRILVNSYHWMKGKKAKLRFEYLRDLRIPVDMEEAWRSVWQSEHINFQNEQEFFDIFFSAINRLLENDEE